MRSSKFGGLLFLAFISICFSSNAFASITDAGLGLTVNVRAYLEGALRDNGGATSENGRSLMRDDLRNNPITGANYIPSKDPYTYSSGFVDVSEKFNKVGPGANPLFQEIPNPEAVFAIAGQNAIVDWVFVELRDKDDDKLVVATRSGLLQRDGDVVDLDGVSGLSFAGVADDEYYVAVRHYKHLGVMSKLPQTKEQLAETIDFTDSSFPTFDYGTTHSNGVDYSGLAQKNEGNGISSMWAGDLDGNGIIKIASPNDDLTYLQAKLLMHPDNTDLSSNFGEAYGYSCADLDMNGVTKLDNPDDDRNVLISSVLFYSLNTSFAGNYEFFIEQLPK